MTETGMITSNPLDGERIGGTVGPPLPGVSVRVVDADGNPCAAGEVGGVEVNGPNVFCRLLAHAGQDARGIHRRRVLPYRRRRRVPAERLPQDRRPREGPHHHRRAQRLSEGNRGEDRRASRRRRIRGHRRARCRFRRSGRGGGRRATRPCADGGGRDRGAARARSRASRCRSGSSSSRSCRATRWARSRRTSCASASRSREAARRAYRHARHSM